MARALPHAAAAAHIRRTVLELECAAGRPRRTDLASLENATEARAALLGWAAAVGIPVHAATTGAGA